MDPLTEIEQSRILPLVKENGDLRVGDKCPREGCNGILESSAIIFFEEKNKKRPMWSFDTLACSNANGTRLVRGKRKRPTCDFKYIPNGVSEQIEAWRKER